MNRHADCHVYFRRDGGAGMDHSAWCVVRGGRFSNDHLAGQIIPIPRRAAPHAAPLAFLVIFWRTIVIGVVLGLILGAFVVKASSPSLASSQDGYAWGVIPRDDGDALITSAHDNEHVRPLTANAHDDERISPIARGKISIPDIIRQAALEFSQSPDEMLAVARCESSLRPDVYGDGGAALGLYQFHIWRWNLNAPHLGYTEDLRADPVAASRVAAYAFATGQRSAWTCRG